MGGMGDKLHTYRHRKRLAASSLCAMVLLMLPDDDDGSELWGWWRVRKSLFVLMPPMLTVNDFADDDNDYGEIRILSCRNYTRSVTYWMFMFSLSIVRCDGKHLLTMKIFCQLSLTNKFATQRRFYVHTYTINRWGCFNSVFSVV